MLTKTFFIDLHGCAKNQVDAEIIVGIMEKIGWKQSLDIADADLVIINSCGFIDKAKAESINAVISARDYITSNKKNTKILLAGCLSERYGDVFLTDLPEADAFFGNGDLSKLPEVINRLFPGESVKEPVKLKQKSSHRIILKPIQSGISCGIRPKILNFKRSVYIKITEGCDNFCSFCAIPIIRGRLRSRSIDDIISEIKSFLLKDFFEFNLIGQDLAAFTCNCDESDSIGQNGRLSGLAQLLKAISKLTGDFRIRLLYIHPDHFPLDILPILTADERFLPYFDIPFQSGSEKIISLMNRTGNKDSYLNLVMNIREAFRSDSSIYKEPVIRTTFLTGFPGETDYDFNETIDFLKQIKPLWSGGFTYSREEDTKAYFFKNRVPQKIAHKRLCELQKIQTEITSNLLLKKVGHIFRILVEELIPGEINPSEDDFNFIALGRAWFQAPEVDGAVVLNYTKNNVDIAGQTITQGSIVNAKIIAVNGFDLEAIAI